MKKVIVSQTSLSKFIAQAGVCARRKATILIEDGAVTVNGEQIREPGYKIMPADIIKVHGQTVTYSEKKIYILLNKPKGYITTVSDEIGRRTVMELLGNEVDMRVYPVGRLDRNTTGLLLLTNDGFLAQKLSHPSSHIQKIYQVSVDKLVTYADLNKIKSGIMLEDGLIQLDTISFLDGRNHLELELHSGRYRIIRRLFEALGYDVKKLDRVQYAHLTKKGLPVGSWRYLNPDEIDRLVRT